MNESSPFNFLTTFSKSDMPLILTNTDISSVLSINAAAIRYLNNLRIYITSSQDLVKILKSFTKGNIPPVETALAFQFQLYNSVNQPVELTIRVQQEQLSGKQILLFSVLGSRQITDKTRIKESTKPENTLPIILIGLTTEGKIEYINRSVQGVAVEQIVGSNIDNWTLPDQFGDVRYYEQAIDTALPVVYESKVVGPNGIPLDARLYLTALFEQEEPFGFILTLMFLNEFLQNS